MEGEPPEQAENRHARHRDQRDPPATAAGPLDGVATLSNARIHPFGARAAMLGARAAMLGARTMVDGPLAAVSSTWSTAVRADSPEPEPTGHADP
jgi:hypothetical protein